jgi:hypothetical protein
MRRSADTALSCGVVPGGMTNGMTKLAPASARAASQWPSVTPRIRSARLVASVADPAGGRRTRRTFARPSEAPSGRANNAELGGRVGA